MNYAEFDQRAERRVRADENVRTNVRAFMSANPLGRRVTVRELAEAVGLPEYRVQGCTTLRPDAKNRPRWTAGELDEVARHLRIPLYLFHMDPDEAWDAAIALRLVRRPSCPVAA